MVFYGNNVNVNVNVNSNVNVNIGGNDNEVWQVPYRRSYRKGRRYKAHLPPTYDVPPHKNNAIISNGALCCHTRYSMDHHLVIRNGGTMSMSQRCNHIHCANCGGEGHVYRICNYPISSFGVICYRAVHGKGKAAQPEYLLVQRNDSLCYVEFIRGKYVLQNRGYIMKLLSNMTADERSRIESSGFDELWQGFWQSDTTRTFMKEYEQSKARFTALSDGYLLRTAAASTAAASPIDNEPKTMPTNVVFFSLGIALAGTVAKHAETEWGFPKGRRNINESDLRCACREFKEETGFDVSGIHVLSHVKPFEEIFSGSNRVRYRHVYYLAQLKPRHDSTPPVLDMMQQREIRTAGWFDFDGVMARIRDENVERREMFKRVHQWVCNEAFAGVCTPSL